MYYIRDFKKQLRMGSMLSDHHSQERRDSITVIWHLSTEANGMSLCVMAHPVFIGMCQWIVACVTDIITTH